MSFYNGVELVRYKVETPLGGVALIVIGKDVMATGDDTLSPRVMVGARRVGELAEITLFNSWSGEVCWRGLRFIGGSVLLLPAPQRPPRTFEIAQRAKLVET